MAKLSVGFKGRTVQASRLRGRPGIHGVAVPLASPASRQNPASPVRAPLEPRHPARLDEVGPTNTRHTIASGQG
jgi:hypothetical protein